MSFLWHYFYINKFRTSKRGIVMGRRVAVRGIALHDGKILCVRLRPYPGKIRAEGGDYWCLPGGGLEDGESLSDGIQREMVEETGIKPNVGKLLFIQQFTFEDTEGLEFFFHIINSEDYLHVDLSKTSHGEKELAEIKFIEPKAVRVLPTFLSVEPLETIAASHDPVHLMSFL
jgi:8-oxo-dGTP diphosphatase